MVLPCYSILSDKIQLLQYQQYLGAIQKNLLGTGFRAALDSLASSNLGRNDVTVRVVGFPQVMAHSPGILLVRVYAGEFIWCDNTVGGPGMSSGKRVPSLTNLEM